MKKSNFVWMCSAFLFLGVIIGFFVSPIKKGIGNDSGNRYTIEKYISSDEPSYEDDDEEDLKF